MQINCGQKSRQRKQRSKDIKIRDVYETSLLYLVFRRLNTRYSRDVFVYPEDFYRGNGGENRQVVIAGRTVKNQKDSG